MTVEKMKTLNDFCIAAKILGMGEEEVFKRIMDTDTFRTELSEEVSSVIHSYYILDFAEEGI